MRRRFVTACLSAGIATLCICVLAACNNGVEQAGQAGDNHRSTATTGSSPSPTSPTTPVPTTPAPNLTVTHGPITLPSPFPSGGQITVSGTVQVGAEPSCLTVTDSGRQYLLLTARPNQIKDGDVIKVTGHIVSGIMTHCMQGIPFEVTQVNVMSHG